MVTSYQLCHAQSENDDFCLLYNKTINQTKDTHSPTSCWFQIYSLNWQSHKDLIWRAVTWLKADVPGPWWGPGWTYSLLCLSLLRTHTAKLNEPRHSFKGPCRSAVRVWHLYFCGRSGCKSTQPAIICTWSDYGQHKVYYRGEKNLFKEPLNQPLLNEQRRCQDLFVSQMALFSLLHSWLTTSRMLLLHFIQINVPSFLLLLLPSFIPDLPFLYHPCLFPHYPILPFSFYPTCMYSCEPSPHLARQTFFQEWHELRGEGEGIGC